MTLPTTNYLPAQRQPRWTVYLSWALILACVGYIFTRIYLQPPGGADAANSQLQLVCRHSVGSKSLLPMAPVDELASQLKAQAKSPTDKLVISPALAELQGKDAAMEYLRKIDDQSLTPELSKVRDNLLQLYTQGAESLSEAQRSTMVEELGWCGKLALAHGETFERDAVLGQARRTTATLLGAFVGMLGVLVLGIAAGITALVLALNGSLQRHYQRDLPPLAPYVEAFALFLVLYVLGSLLRRSLGDLGAAGMAGVQVLVLLPALWPILRGENLATFKHRSGLHAGRGVFTEIGCGALGYLAGIPIIAVGIVITLGLVYFTKIDPPVHPIISETDGGIWTALLLYFLAAVMAPIMEETMFRGLLYHHVRSKLPWVLSALLTGILFAAIHPQGWAAIPALTGIGFVVAMIREWRGSLIGSMTAHAINNGVLVTILLLATS